jgi:F-type H+-transporting ATPase subunit gamma
MNLVAASKLQRAKAKLSQNKAYYEETKRVMASIAAAGRNVRHPLMTPRREVKNNLLVVITSDRGLCGSYNVNVSREARKFMRTVGNVYNVISVGNKGKEFFRRRKKKVLETFTGISENPFYDDAAVIAGMALDLYRNGTVDCVYLAYTEFISTISYQPKIMRLLPLEAPETVSVSGMIYEPSEEAVLDALIPKYLETVMFGALLESAACQLGARMTGMDAATDNAGKMMDKLNLQYNRARQGAITQEITEIVSGANAL